MIAGGHAVIADFSYISTSFALSVRSVFVVYSSAFSLVWPDVGL